MEISPIKHDNLEKYFLDLFKADVKIVRVEELGPKVEKPKEELKGFGYGVPYVIELLVKGEPRKFVLETIRPGSFGHEHFSDRAQTLIWQHSAFNKLESHVRSVDVGAFTVDNSLVSVGGCKEFFIVTEFVEGQPYYMDLERIKMKKQLSELDMDRCKALSNYLVNIHSVKEKSLPSMYVRRIRELLGHGECIMGLIDSYPAELPYVTDRFLAKVEKKCVEWRWKIKRKTYRCTQVHGDFHPWNVLFRQGVDFTILDRSRGEWGEPADDLTAMSINYLFYSLQMFGCLKGPFKELFEIFWKNYLDKTGDTEILTIVQPFFAWRGLVIASPIWYPNLTRKVRRKIFLFIQNVLETEEFDIQHTNSYLGK